jgi:hypothetical protein
MSFWPEETTSWFSRILSLCLVTALLGGCAATGRGNFPPFPITEERNQKTLAVIPPVGASAERISGSVLYHLNRPKIGRTFKSVRVITDESVQDILRGHASLSQVSSSNLDKLKRTINADLMLVFFVNDLRVTKFSTTETERLESTSSRYQNTDIQSNRGDASITSMGTEYSAQEIPVTEGNIRAVISMSSGVYDFNQNRIIWSGRRIERTQDELKDLSAVELVDIVVERVMYRIVSRLTA